MPDLPYSYDIEIVSLLASNVHRYEGRPSDGPRDAAGREAHDSIDVRAGLGVVGDRYFGQAAHVTASVTIQSIEALEHVQRVLDLDYKLTPTGTRRNIMVRGMPVDELRDETFSLDSGRGEVLFHAHRPANPCAWMDVVLAPGAHRALRGRGGMRCSPESSGTLLVGLAVLRVARRLHAPALF